MREAKVNMEVLTSYLHIQLCYFDWSRKTLNVISMRQAYRTIDRITFEKGKEKQFFAYSSLSKC